MLMAIGFWTIGGVSVAQETAICLWLRDKVWSAAMKEPLLGLLVASRDQPGVLYRVAEAIFKHKANIEYIAGGSRTGEVAELQIEVSGAADEARLVADIEALEGIT
jgi:hypothetical protein